MGIAVYIAVCIIVIIVSSKNMSISYFLIFKRVMIVNIFHYEKIYSNLSYLISGGTIQLLFRRS